MKKIYSKFLMLLVVTLCANTGFSQSKLSESNYKTIISDYLSQVKGDYNLSANDLLDLYVNSEVYTTASKFTSLYIHQRFQGVKIFNAISTVTIKDNKVIYYANNFLNNLNLKVNTTQPVLSAAQAVDKAAQHFNLSGLRGLEEVSNSGNQIIFTNGNISQHDIPVELILTPVDNGLIRLSWDLSINTMDGKHWWHVRVDAITGEILNFNDWIVNCNFEHTDTESNHTHINSIQESTFNLFKENSILADGSQYRVFAIPVESPNHGSRTLVFDPSISNASPYGWHDTDGVVGAEFTITRGNNVWAQEDRDANSGTGFAPSGSATLNFDFPLNINQAPAAYESASLTNLFYGNNIMHDVLYQYGFNEASGNFQQTNYGNSGVGNDYVRADGQDGASLNNATFGTPPEGTSPTMTMFLWSAPSLKKLVTVNNSSLAGQYTAVNPASNAENNITGASTMPVTGNLILVNDGSIAPFEGCGGLTNAASVAGKIALIRRGTCNFVQKIQNAQNAGAIGVIMMNHNNPTNDLAYTEYVNMAGLTTPAFTIPSVFVNYADGLLMAAALQNGETLNVTLQDYQSFQLDGSFDNSIVFHEYGHGVSNRLTGGALNTSCLTNKEQMGEGWSDFFGLMLTIKPGDTGDMGRGIATYAAGQEIDGRGIRPAQYSTDFAIDNITYGATNNNTIIGTSQDGTPIAWNEIPHNIGYVWASILWDLNWAYIEKYGFDQDIYNGNGGNNRVLRLVMDGLKLQPCNPGFVTGRNALLAADMASTGGADQCLIWNVFAKRGVGRNASQGAANNLEDQIEDFTRPPDRDPSLANCTTLSVGENILNNYKIYPNPTVNEINISVTKNFGPVKITMHDLNGRAVYNQNTDLNGTVKIKFGQLQAGLYIMNVSGEGININEKIIIK